MDSSQSSFAHSDQVNGITPLRAHDNNGGGSPSTSSTSSTEPDHSDRENRPPLRIFPDSPMRLLESPTVYVDNSFNSVRDQLPHEIYDDDIYHVSPSSSDPFNWDFNPDETNTITILRPLSHLLEEAIIPKQCAKVEECVEKGWHLAALVWALNYSCETAFEGNYSKIFTAGIHVFHLGGEDEAPGTFLRFRKRLSLELKQYVARQLLRGILIRYPRRSFPRTFWVTEGNADPLILQINNAVGTHMEVYEHGRVIHDAIVRQWEQDCYFEGSGMAGAC
ncbi:hypothetical protein HD806DRAFT_518695 [Xylariaceae sp. AK1471]|nr:hypothetical protein HD806DRAFT_518695 [Xylariaceae sp. AK1471]